MSHPDFKALKIGVTGDGKRIDDHEELGWTLLRDWSFDCGYDALEAEELVLDRWRNVFSSPQAVASLVMPQGGASETTRDTPAARSDTIAFVVAFREERCPMEDSAWE